MKVRNVMFGTVAALVLGFALPCFADAAERGTLKNNTNITIVYQAGYADARGYISWQTFSLAPGQSHVWTVQNPQRRPLAIRWDLTLGDGKFIPTQTTLPTRPNGYRSGFFLNGRQVWIDTSGGAR